MPKPSKLAMLAVLLAVGVAAPGHADSRDERAFAADMIRQLGRKAPMARAAQQVDPLSVQLSGGDWDGATVNLHRIYGYCRQAKPADCATAQTEFLDKILRKPPIATAANLRIAVRDKQYVDYILSLPPDEKTGEPAIIADAIGDDLFAILVADSADTLAMATRRQLRELGLTQEQAWSKAWLQTRVKLPALPAADQLKTSAVVYQDQEYLASLLADADGWKTLARVAGPDLFVTVVADNFVFVGRMADGPELDKFKQTVREDCAAQQRCVSPNLYRFREGRWVVAH